MIKNFLKPSEKKNPAPPATPSRLQGKEKRIKNVTYSSIVSNPPTVNKMKTANPNPSSTPEDKLPTPETLEWQQIESKQSKTKQTNDKKREVSKKQLLDTNEDSDSEAEEEVSSFDIPSPHKNYLLQDQSILKRFTITFELESTLDPVHFLKQSASRVNKALKRLTTTGQLQGYPGKAVILPWEDEELYSNRAWSRVKRSTEHTSLLSLIRCILYGYGAPKGRKQDVKISKKFCRIQIAWLSPDILSDDKKSCLSQFLKETRLFEPEFYTIYPAPTDAINPTIAIQFRQSIVSDPANWNNKGQEDCLTELNKMIQSFLPENIQAGLKKVTLATGQNFTRGDPMVMTLECDKKDEEVVTKDVLNAFRLLNRRSQICDKLSVPWIAIPYFKGHGIQSNPKYMPQYTNIKAKEALYQDSMTMRYMEHIHSLDTAASPHFHLTKEFLKQLEENIWEHHETPIRALIYEKLWRETKQSLFEEKISRKKNPTEKQKQTELNKITFGQVLDEMARKGYETLAPTDDLSFPVPNPSARTLRQFLMSIKSRRTDDADKATYVFESINKTDDDRVLFTFSKSNLEEATTILDCLPLFIQHEMHLDPSSFLDNIFIKTSIGSYYNPLTRTGYTSIAACLQEDTQIQPNPAHRIPEAIRKASASDIELIFKRKENKMFTFPEDTDLASVAGTIASFQALSPNESDTAQRKITNLQMLLQTHHLGKNSNDEVSNLSDGSGLSFDSKTSKNKYEIDRRATQLASKQVEQTVLQMKIQQGLKLLETGHLTKELAITLELPYDDILDKAKTLQNTVIPSQKSTPTPEEEFVDAMTTDNPANLELPESDNESDNDSDTTPVMTSPNKTTAAGSQNVGVTK